MSDEVTFESIIDTNHEQKAIIEKAEKILANNLKQNASIFKKLFIKKSQTLLENIPQVKEIFWAQVCDYDNDYNRTADIEIIDFAFYDEDGCLIESKLITPEQHKQLDQFYDNFEKSYDFLAYLFDWGIKISITKDGLKEDVYKC